MNDAKDRLLMIVEARARRRLGELSCRMVRPAGDNPELILAEIEFQRWLSDTCRHCLSLPGGDASEFGIGSDYYPLL